MLRGGMGVPDAQALQPLAGGCLVDDPAGSAAHAGGIPALFFGATLFHPVVADARSGQQHPHTVSGGSTEPMCGFRSCVVRYGAGSTVLCGGADVAEIRSV